MKTSSYKLELCLLTILVITNLSTCAVLRNRTNNEPGLYSPQDNLDILTIDNFNATVYNSNRAWLVEFYSNWCGYCQRAVPLVKAFGTDVKGWKDLVVVAVFDCANERNAPICENFRITKYPTFRYIHEEYIEGPENKGLPVVADSHTNFTEHRQHLVNIMIKEQTEGRGKQFPNLQPIRNTTFIPVGNAEFTFFIIQKPDDNVGPTIIMDFHKIKEIAINYGFDNETTMVNKHLHLSDQLPALYSIQQNGESEYVQTSSADRKGIKIAIREILLSRNINVPSEILENTVITETPIDVVNATKEELELRQKIKDAGDTVFQLDLENALRYSLKREVGGNKEIEGEKLDALKKYINVLVKYFPVNEKGKSLLRHVQEYVNSSSSIDGHHINEEMKEADQSDNIYSGPEQWLGCRGSTPTLRGYPCGLWKLFHYLTVNAAFDPTNTKDTNPQFVLAAMHGYIKNFFGCQDCSDHFQAMSKQRKIFEVFSWEESVLWLWRAHNEVNQRLSGDDSEDPLNKKIQFPSKDRCPRCYNADGSWQEVEVLAYLKKMYGSENINYMGADPRVLHLNNKSSRGYRILSTDHSLLFGGLLISINLLLNK